VPTHRMKPIDGRQTLTEHVLLWVGAERQARSKRRQLVMRATGERRAWRLLNSQAGLAVSQCERWETLDELSDLLWQRRHSRAHLTVWIARGWTDFVLLGLAELIDRADYQWRACMLDGAKVMFKGELDGRSTSITSLANWTGGQWDLWRPWALSEPPPPGVASPDVCAAQGWTYPSDDERCALGTLGIVLGGATVMLAGNPRLTIAQQARSWWKSWLGPAISADGQLIRRRDTSEPMPDDVWIAPLPERPPAAAQAERQVAVGLVREQFAHGHVGDKVYVVDLRAAYLAGLLTAAMPLAYHFRVRDVTGQSLHESLAHHVGCALVLIDSPHTPYPVRMAGKPGRATGRFWTWLCGRELANACRDGLARYVHTAWLWYAGTYDDTFTADMIDYAGKIPGSTNPWLKPFFRAMYSSLVGSWAQWSRRWEDDDRDTPFGRWSTWLDHDPETGEIRRYRSVAGRVQCRVDVPDSSPSVPLAYASVTSTLRVAIDAIASRLPNESVLAICADSLWLTAPGFDALQSEKLAPLAPTQSLAIHEVWDDAWLDGSGRAVVERDGKRYPLLIGVPNWAEIGPDGRSRWVSAAPWNADQRPTAKAGVGVHGASFDAGKIVEQNSHPLIWSCPWLELVGGVLREELLLPVQPRIERQEANDE
jgi:hypothetical protein